MLWLVLARFARRRVRCFAPDYLDCRRKPLVNNYLHCVDGASALPCSLLVIIGWWVVILGSCSFKAIQKILVAGDCPSLPSCVPSASRELRRQGIVPCPSAASRTSAALSASCCPPTA